MLSQKSAVFGGGFRFDGPKKPPITWGMGAPFMLSTAGRSWVFVVCLKMDGLWPFVASKKKRFTISFGKFVEGHCFGSNQTPWNTHFSSSWAESTQWLIGWRFWVPNRYQFKEATNTSSLPPFATPPITGSSQPRMNVNNHATFFRWDWNPHKEQNSTFGCFLSQLFGRILFTNSTRLWWKLMILKFYR